MRTIRVHTARPLTSGTETELEGGAAVHVTRVLRLRVGDTLTLFDGSGLEYPAEVRSFGPGRVRVAVREGRAVERESPLHITLAQGISRGERMDFAVQKATELGVRAIVPVSTLRSVVRLDERQAGRRLDHWRGVVIAACEQSGRSRLPEVHPPQSFTDFLAGCREGTAAWDSGTRLLLDPESEHRLDARTLPEGPVTLLIGPEGGLEPSEIERARAAGFRGIRLGPRILRTETAALAAIALLQGIRGDL